MKRCDGLPDFIRSFPEIELPFPGARGWMVQGETQQVVFVELSETLDVPEHSHSEQWEFALAGKVEMRMEGVTRVYEPGENFFIPAGVPHSAKVHAGYRAMMIFNEKDRYKRRR